MNEKNDSDTPAEAKKSAIERQLRLRGLRLRTGLSLDEVGRRVSIERSRLGRAERGYVALTPDEIERIECALATATR